MSGTTRNKGLVSLAYCMCLLSANFIVVSVRSRSETHTRMSASRCDICIDMKWNVRSQQCAARGGGTIRDRSSAPDFWCRGSEPMRPLPPLERRPHVGVGCCRHVSEPHEYYASSYIKHSTSIRLTRCSTLSTLLSGFARALLRQMG